MTPFDPAALLAMLRAFYPAPTTENLRRARQERPEYFAGGVLFGSCGEKLRLPDDRVFDLIFDCGGTGARWQVHLAPPPGTGEPDPYPLEPGPLEPVDAGRFERPKSGRVFEPLVAGRQRELDDMAGAVDAHERVIAGASSPAALESSYRRTVAPAAAVVSSERAAIGTLAPTDVLGRIDGHGGVIQSRRGEIPGEFQAPREFPNYNPGPIPGADTGRPDKPPEV